jgi:hypothetical protein
MPALTSLPGVMVAVAPVSPPVQGETRLPFVARAWANFPVAPLVNVQAATNLLRVVTLPAT